MQEKGSKFYDEVLRKEYPDLYAERQKRRRKMIRNILIYEAIFIAVAISAVDYIKKSIAVSGDTDIIWKAVLLGIILLIVPPFCFKSTYSFIRPTWAGTITDIKYEMRYTQSAGNARMQPSGRIAGSVRLAGDKEFMEMKLLSNKGKKRKLAYRSHINSVLKQGDRIVKFRGFPYPAEEVEKEERYICVICGKVVKKDVTECPVCNHSIIDIHKATQPKDVWAEFNYADFE